MQTGQANPDQRNVKALEAELQHDQAAVEQTDEGYVDLVPQRLAASFMDRYEKSGDARDLEAALQHHQGAVEQIPGGHPDLARHLQNLGILFTERY
jgi:hypothetical protein